MARPAPAPPVTATTPDVRLVPLDSLHLDPHNARTHPDRNLQAIRDSLAAFGQQKPLVVTRTGMILAGNGTWQAAKALGWTQIAVQVTTLADAQARAYALADNRTGELALWDEEALARTLQDLVDAQAPVVGWDDAELTALLASLVPTPAVTPIDESEIAPDRGEVLRAQYGVEPGQLWALGDHRVLCADCLDPASLTRLLAGETPGMILADPPYGINIVSPTGWVGGGEQYDIPFGGVQRSRQRGHVGGGESYKAKHGEYPIQRDKRRGTDGAAKPFGSQKTRGSDGAAGDPSRQPLRGDNRGGVAIDVGKYSPVLGDESVTTAITASTALLAQYPDATHVWWGGNYYADHLPASSCWLVWDKESTGNFADVELAWTNRPKAARLFHHRWNGMLRESERERRWHPTQKPAALMAWAMETCAEPGTIVLDPFLGCGPTVIAGEQRGYPVRALELSPDYIAVTLERWHQLTGLTPELLAS